MRRTKLASFISSQLHLQYAMGFLPKFEEKRILSLISPTRRSPLKDRMLTHVLSVMGGYCLNVHMLRGHILYLKVLTQLTISLCRIRIWRFSQGAYTVTL